MPIIFKTDSPMLGVWRMTECSDELLAMLGRREDYRPFLERVNAETRRREHLASRVLLARLLGYEAQVGYRQDGAPFLFGSSLHISISHTRDYAAVIVGEQPVGIDIEYRSDRVWKIRERFLSSEELAMLDPTNEVEQLLICWCVKEALFKLLGQQSVDFREHLRVMPFEYRESGELLAQEFRTERTTVSRFAYRVTPEYVLVHSLPDLLVSETATAVQ